MPAPVVTVVVPTRGGARRLPILLEALAVQELEEPWEVVFVLDGDVDGSRQVIEAYADRLHVRLVEHIGGDGVGAALAAGYDAALGEIVIRCDDDLTPSPGFLAGHLSRHRDRPAGAPPPPRRRHRSPTSHVPCRQCGRVHRWAPRSAVSSHWVVRSSS